MGRARGLGKYKIAQMMGTGPAVERPAESAERNVLFGTRENRKTIAILAAVGFVLAAILHSLVARSERGFSVVAMLFSALHGGLIGMLFGQLILVYPDRVMVIFTLMGVLLGEFIYLAASGKFDTFEFNRETFQAILAIFFWSGFVGFWFGFVAYARRQEARRRFHERVGQRQEEMQEGQEQAPPGA